MYMRRALSLAKSSGTAVYPNPMVGCVIVAGGSVIAEAGHEYFGDPHAEASALSKAGNKARGATMYVTLEPCSHWGKTPPCADAIIHAGISRVVCAMRDPNPAVSGKGFARLRAHGISLTTGILAPEARSLNRRYLTSLNHRKNSHVTVKAAMTIDGKIATRTGDSKWVTGPLARAFVHRLRSTYDAILVGIGTVLADNPSLTSHGTGHDPVRVVIDPGLRVPLSARVLDGTVPTVIITSKRRTHPRIARIRAKKAAVISLAPKNGKLPFERIVEALKGIGLPRIFVEGGGETIAGAFESGSVDDIYMFIAPKLVGGRTAKTPCEGNGITLMRNALHIQRLTVRRFGPDIMIHGKVQR